MIEAPDYVEPFEAWRVWRVVRRERQYSLGSVIQRTLWPTGEALAAECFRMPRLFSRLRRKREHEAPDASCDCGIYAAGLERIGQYLAEAPCRGVARVLGRVALWGTVIECERGFRAACAYPTRIYIPCDAGKPWGVDWQDVALGLWRYGVPIEALSSSSADSARVLAEVQSAAA